MDFNTERARFTSDPALANWVTGALQGRLDQQEQSDAARVAEAARWAEKITLRDTELHAAKTKIQALTLELAHLRRMRFGARSEALSADQRDLFQETLASDLAAA